MHAKYPRRKMAISRSGTNGTLEGLGGEVYMLHLGTEKIDLAQIPPFHGMEDSLLENAADWVFYFSDGQKIFAQGDPVESLIVIVRGEIQILSQAMSMVTRRQHETVGEQGFLSSKACRTADAFARGTVEVLQIPGAVVRRLMETNLQFNRNLLQIVSGKLAEATSDRAYRYRNESRLIAAFGAHLSPEITARLLSSGDEYGKPRLIDGVVLFADIRGFTSTSLMLPPDQLASELGGYLDEMVKVLLEHHAYVDKFIGDAVMGVWGFPFAADHQASEAFACAKQMVRKAREKRINGAPVQIGVGLSAGRIFCGNVGSDLKKQFTVLGHDVNLAARCESACMDLNVSVVLSEAVYDRLPDTEKSELTLYPVVSVKGIGDIGLYSIGNQEAVDMPQKEGTR
jgi:class 3 adenylate cyclase